MSLLKLRQTNKLPNKQIAHYSICKKKIKKSSHLLKAWVVFIYQ